MTSPKRLFLIDGMAQIYRAHFAMIKNPLTTKDGRHTSAIFGFMNSLFKLLRDENPDYIAVVLDCKEPTFRHKLYTEYKATREKMPDELVEQLEPLYEVISHTNIPILKKPGYEADDIIGTLVKKAEQAGLVTYMVTGDKDMMQLVSETTFMYSPGNRFKPTTIYDKIKVKEKWGVGPDGIIDMLALVGDTSDNVPGVDGVGPKTAKKLLDQYKDIETILEHADEAKNKRVREGLQNGRDLVHLSRELVTIHCDVPVEFHIEELIRKDMDGEALTYDFQDLEMYSLITQVEALSGNGVVALEQPDKNYQTILTQTDLDLLITTISNAELISFDLETTSITPLQADIVGLSFSVKANDGYYIPVEYPEKESKPGLTLDAVLEKLKPIFENENNRFCGQNIKYDALVLSRYGIHLGNIVFDTMIAEYMLHPEKNSYKMDYLSIDYLNYRMVPIDNLIGTGLHQKSMAEVPLEDIAFYASEDADIAFQLAEILKDKLEKESLFEPYNDIEIPLIPVLTTIEKNGVYLNLDFLADLSRQFGEGLEKLTEKIHQMAGREFNINSPKQLGEILFDELELKPIRKRSTAVEVLAVLKNYHPLPEEVLKYRHLAKLKNTYVDAIPNYVNKETGRVHTSLNQTIAATGRLSSTSPNFQNIPIRTETGREVRKAFVPQNSDWVILSADYSQVELRIMAHYSQEPELIKAFEENSDIHSRTAALVNGIAEAEVTPDQRRSAKVVNFGIMYGAGPYRMSQELGISMADAKILIDNYFATYPGIRKYMDETISLARDRGYVETLYKRRRKTGNLDASNRNIVQAEERVAINMPIQGTAADIIKIAMINIHNKMESENYQSKMILQIHDELLFECPKAEVDKLAAMVVEKMEGAVSLSVPLKVDWNYGSSWYEAH
ncbi:MAG TPA: DNA polymerase I [Candidatus Marinimicrobia bacterium]|jgi:DNA polymerase-1|nr:DNA polymerase I [Candidatus Neomarinimicrobiota bacterium]